MYYICISFVLATRSYVLHCCKILLQEPVTGRQEGWRDGLSRREDEKMLNTIIPGPQAKVSATPISYLLPKPHKSKYVNGRSNCSSYQEN